MGRRLAVQPVAAIMAQSSTKVTYQRVAYQMNNYERVMAAMRVEQPDRVPVVELLIDPAIQQAICPGARDFGDVAEFLDLEGPVRDGQGVTDLVMTTATAGTLSQLHQIIGWTDGGLRE